MYRSFLFFIGILMSYSLTSLFVFLSFLSFFLFLSLFFCGVCVSSCDNRSLVDAFTEGKNAREEGGGGEEEEGGGPMAEGEQQEKRSISSASSPENQLFDINDFVVCLISVSLSVWTFTSSLSLRNEKTSLPPSRSL